MFNGTENDNVEIEYFTYLWDQYLRLEHLLMNMTWIELRMWTESSS